jgi:hypothetical protein
VVLPSIAQQRLSHAPVKYHSTFLSGPFILHFTGDHVEQQCYRDWTISDVEALLNKRDRIGIPPDVLTDSQGRRAPYLANKDSQGRQGMYAAGEGGERIGSTGNGHLRHVDANRTVNCDGRAYSP